MRWAVALLLLAGCAHLEGAEAPRLEVFSAYLPRETVGSVPFRPEQLRGKVVLVTFIATWCFPCLADLVTLQKLQRDYGPRGFENVLVGMDLEGRRVLEPFASTYPLDFPVLVGSEQLRDGQTPFGKLHELPSRVLFGRDGAVIVGYSGVLEYPALERYVKAGLAEKE